MKNVSLLRIPSLFDCVEDHVADTLLPRLATAELRTKTVRVNCEINESERRPAVRHHQQSPVQTPLLENLEDLEPK